MTMNDKNQIADSSGTFREKEPMASADMVSDRMALDRLDAGDAPWAARPWIMALVGAVTGLFIWLLAEKWDDALGDRLTLSLATASLIGAVSFILGVEQRRWQWALLFSLFWGAVGGLIFWQTIGIDRNIGAIFWPFFSVVLAILIATPFFQTQRDQTERDQIEQQAAGGASRWRIWQLPYARLHDHAWIDAVLGAAGLFFILICFAMLALIGGLFGLIGIKFFTNLLRADWFMMGLAGAAFGAAVGLLRERDRLVSVLQRLVMVVLSVLAPVLAAALLMFLASLPIMGLQELWNGGFSSAYLLLAVAAASLLLANSVIGNHNAELSHNRVMRGSAGVLAAAVLPLAVLAVIALYLRIDQYGWTPSRLWGAIAAAVALAYGLAGAFSVLRGRWDFAETLRDAQKKLAVAVMALAFFLALPILDFGAISTHNQVERLQSGAVTVKAFDWGALAFDFGPSGREALKRLARSENEQWAASAAGALKAKSRWVSDRAAVVATAAPFEQRVRVLPQGAALTPDARKRIDEMAMCMNLHGCLVYVLGPRHLVILTQSSAGQRIYQQELVQNDKGDWGSPEWAEMRERDDNWPDLKTADVALGTVKRHQLRVGDAVQPILQRPVP